MASPQSGTLFNDVGAWKDKFGKGRKQRKGRNHKKRR